VDLTKISAKSVRMNMLASDETLDPSWVKQNKEGIDDLIAQIFSTVNSQQVQPSQAPMAASPSTSPTLKRKRMVNDGEHANGNGDSLTPSQTPISHVTNNHKHRPSSAAQKTRQQQLSDAELARQLSAELNPLGRTTRGSGPGSRKHTSGAGGAGSGTKGGRGSSKKVKSSAKIIDNSDNEHGSADEDDSYNDSDDGSKRRRKKSNGGGSRTSEGGGGAKGGFAKEFVLSPPLAALTGEATLSRPQVVKALWKHIKENQLQNPKDRRVILCDDKVCGYYILGHLCYLFGSWWSRPLFCLTASSHIPR
jgi:upstream activation factor subunit UAF30